MRIFVKIVIWLIIIGGLGGAGYYGYLQYTTVPERQYRTAPVKRGALLSTINSTGTVEAEELIDIGAQVAGVIQEFGNDKNGDRIDYNSVVEANTVLAQIDATLYKADLAQAQAQIAIDTAGVQRAEADEKTAEAKHLQAQSDLIQLKARLDQAKEDLELSKSKLDQTNADIAQSQAKFEQAQRDWDRAQKLGPSDALSHQEFDAFKGVFEAAKAAHNSVKFTAVQAQHSIVSQKAVIAQAEANVASQVQVIAQAEASILSAKAAIAQAKAAILHDEAARDRAQTNVGYCTIKSPVDGVIIDRRVNVGQTVVSSLNAPSLFLLAKDLTKMVVWASVNEADLGAIHPGQPATFTVDTYPGRIFPGKVRKARKNATSTQNVVTYTVEVATENKDGALWPYMTANTLFEVARREDALLVPNAALRYTPRPEEIAPDVVPDDDKPAHGTKKAGSDSTVAATTDQHSSEKPAKGDADTPGKADDPPAKSGAKGRMSRAKVWIKDGNFVRPIRIRTGITDGTHTEVKSDELKEDMQLVVGRQSTSGDAAGAGTNPFAPQMGRPRNTSSSTPK